MFRFFSRRSKEKSQTVRCLQAHTEVQYLTGHTKFVRQLVPISEDHFLSCGDDNEIICWNSVLGTCDGVLKGHNGPVLGLVACSLGHEHFVISGSSDKTVRVWSLQTFECLQVEKLEYSPFCFTRLPNSDYFLIGAIDTLISLWKFSFDNKSGCSIKLCHSIDRENPYESIRYLVALSTELVAVSDTSHAEIYLYNINLDEEKIKFIQASNASTEPTKRIVKSITKIGFSDFSTSDCMNYAVGYSDGVLDVWSLKSKEKSISISNKFSYVPTMPGNALQINRILDFPDGFCVFASADELYVLDLLCGCTLSSCASAGKSICHIEPIYDGKRLVTITINSVIKFWHIIVTDTPSDRSVSMGNFNKFQRKIHIQFVADLNILNSNSLFLVTLLDKTTVAIAAESDIVLVKDSRREWEYRNRFAFAALSLDEEALQRGETTDLKVIPPKLILEPPLCVNESHFSSQPENYNPYLDDRWLLSESSLHSK